MFIANNVSTGYLRIGLTHGSVNHIAHNDAHIPSHLSYSEAGVGLGATGFRRTTRLGGKYGPIWQPWA